MRHRVDGYRLGRTSAHRRAMYRNQLAALFTHERIITTLTKAKALRPVAERMVTLARSGSLPARRQVLRWVPDREVVTRLFDDIAPRFVDRPGGYTRIMRMGRRRGDGAELAIIEFVDYTLETKPQAGGEKKASLMDRAKGMFGGGRAGEQPAEEEAPEAVAPEEEQEAAAPDEPEAPKRKRSSTKKSKAEKAKAAEEESGTEDDE